MRPRLPRRWLHVRAVAGAAKRVAARCDLDAELLVASAWLHDLGYLSDHAVSGLHALDGARVVDRLGFPSTVVSLVAYHSLAIVEADLRGLGDVLRSEFDPPDQQLANALCYCDMVTGPSGLKVTVEERLAEIRQRYGAGDVVTSFVDAAEYELIETVRQVEARLAVAKNSQPM
jgi:putative nucleotidyltransferase with HDIG domain